MAENFDATSLARSFVRLYHERRLWRATGGKRAAADEGNPQRRARAGGARTWPIERARFAWDTAWGTAWGGISPQAEFAVPARSNRIVEQPERVRLSVRRGMGPLRPGSYGFARDLYFQRIGALGFVHGAIKVVTPPEAASLRMRASAFI